MHNIRRKLCAALATLPLALAFNTQAQAQTDTWPERPITMIVPFPPGGPTDLIARVIAKQLSEQVGQPVVVDNRGGANGTIGMTAAANAKADGYTILYNTSSISLSPNLFKELAFDPVKDFDAVTSTAVIPMVLLAHPSVPANTVQEFIEYAKKNPGKLSYGSAGAGNITHLTAFLFNQSTGIDAVHIPYRGSAPAMTDLVGGQTAFMTNTMNDSLPYIRANRLKALAITSKQRSPELPDVPTVAESVIPEFDMGAWQGIVVPAGTPPAIIERLNTEILTALKTPSILEQLAKQGAQPLGSSSQDYAAYIQNEIKRLGDVIRAAGVKLN
ncbi:tripartite tricarboxylate transporter substrate binding protein [Pusillimonas sp. MFBS29]|uniref:Bug family tripartite tricarboxylate transporter substrate binding protein n=1 Tax=Pusillimonas sp. MFBS29 TaxID=2886690 RepID=UPI001D0F7747|nr:tripartite tricarboxylate transporter substrate binding protein [Pusillimonas sp. MFBS29]MCC2595753.1 tripartite tricarboxylate transporter substrate binding protein [Pusillimonas sp. MFBS29]